MRLLVSGVCLAVVLASGNFVVAVLAPRPWDVTSQRSQTLSPQTSKVLADLQGEVAVTLLSPSHVRTPDERSFDRAAGMLRDLLAHYQNQSAALTVRRVVAEGTAEAYQLRQQFPDAVPPCVLLTCTRAGGKVRHEVLRHQDLIEFQDGGGGQVGGIDIFAERAVTGALSRLSSETPQTVVYSLIGHGELALETQSADSRRSISELAGFLRLLNIEIRPLDLTGDAEVPADADVVLIAGPQTALSAVEAGKLKNYLKHGGSGLWLLDAVRRPSEPAVLPTGLESVLKQYGVLLGQDFLVTQFSGHRPMTATSARIAGGDHPLLRELPRTALTLKRCRSVRILPGSAQRNSRCRPLLLSPAAPRSWAERNLSREEIPAFQPDEDLPGPVSMGVFVERLDRSAAELMLVVVGDADFTSNRQISSPQQDATRGFLLGAISRLAGKKNAMADIPIGRRRRYELPGTADQHRSLIWMSVLGLSALITTTGGTVWTIRRNG